MSALQSTFGSFAIRDFRYFWTVLLISSLALTLAYVLMPIALRDAAGLDSTWSITWFYVAHGSAVIVFGLFAAVAADRFAKKPLMLIGLIGAAIMLILLGALIVAGLTTWGVILRDRRVSWSRHVAVASCTRRLGRGSWYRSG